MNNKKAIYRSLNAYFFEVLIRSTLTFKSNRNRSSYWCQLVDHHNFEISDIVSNWVFKLDVVYFQQDLNGELIEKYSTYIWLTHRDSNLRDKNLPATNTIADKIVVRKRQDLYDQNNYIDTNVILVPRGAVEKL